MSILTKACRTWTAGKRRKTTHMTGKAIFLKECPKRSYPRRIVHVHLFDFTDSNSKHSNTPGFNSKRIDKNPMHRKNSHQIKYFLFVFLLMKASICKTIETKQKMRGVCAAYLTKNYNYLHVFSCINLKK